MNIIQSTVTRFQYVLFLLHINVIACTSSSSAAAVSKLPVPSAVWLEDLYSEDHVTNSL